MPWSGEDDGRGAQLGARNRLSGQGAARSRHADDGLELVQHAYNVPGDGVGWGYSGGDGSCLLMITIICIILGAACHDHDHDAASVDRIPRYVLLYPRGWQPILVMHVHPRSLARHVARG